MFEVVLSSARRSKSDKHICSELISTDIYSIGIGLAGEVERIEVCHRACGEDSFVLRAELIGAHGQNRQKAFFCRNISRSTEILERASSIAISLCNSLSPSMLLAFNSINTERWSNKPCSLFLICNQPH